ncbi:MAG TPA: low temperature requirement protein A [Pseudonocardiaceae bacterium]|nr:low temperature requirement protein A [Pseudonocardiaceae bacterium]
MSEADEIRAPWYRPMRARATDEPDRAATPLELLFDLCFVVAVSLAAARLHHAVSAGEIGHGVLGYLLVFFSIWWAWMNFTWFASAYDTDDGPYRLATLVQIAGVLVLAAGVPRAFDQEDFRIGYLGYAIMRLGLATLWLRAACANSDQRPVAVRYAVGITTAMLGWLGVLFAPVSVRPVAFLVMAMVELTIPFWAERGRRTPWHPHHIAERYGCFTLIVLGESVTAATTALQPAFDAGHQAAALLWVAVGGLLIVFSLWWLYFDQPAHRMLRSNRDAFPWGYGHFFIFASVAAVGAGLQVAVDHATGSSELSAHGAALALTAPVALFLLFAWLLHVRPHRRGVPHDAGYPITAALVLAGTLTPIAVPLTGMLLAALVAVTTVVGRRTPTE